MLSLESRKVGLCLAVVASPYCSWSHSLVLYCILTLFILCNFWTADVNECTSGTASCHLHASCRNTYGSYTCSCNTGYTGNGFSCTRKFSYLLQMHCISFLHFKDGFTENRGCNQNCIFNYFAYNKNVFLAQAVVAGTLCMFHAKIYEWQCKFKFVSKD